MTLIRIIMQLVLVGLSIFGISAFMETYKTKIRKGNAKVWEIRVVSAVVSALAAVGFKFTGIFTPVITYFFPNVTVWIDVLLYAAVIWALQLQGDMGILKAVIKYATNNFPTGNKILTDEVKRLIDTFQDNTKIDITKVVKIAEVFGFNEDMVINALTTIGADKDKADAIIAAYKKAVEERNNTAEEE